MSKRAIPTVPAVDKPAMKQFLQAVKEHVESISGGRGGKLLYLQENATNTQIIAKINEIIRRLQE